MSLLRTSLPLLFLLSIARLATAEHADPPPPKPPLGDLDARANALLQAIIHDEPERATSLFLPREAFREIKAVRNPDALYDRLLRAYERDIHALHVSHPNMTHATFVRVQLSRRRSYVLKGEEGNLLPYWAQRHNSLIYKLNNQEHTLELRVLIAWNNQWYITHLSEFR